MSFATMKLRNPSNGETLEEPQNPRNGDFHTPTDDIDSNCSTPYVSAPSSPGRMGPSASSGYFFSAPASPMHYVLSSAPFSAAGKSSSGSPEILHSGGSFEFGGASPSGPMISADELFLNGQIRPMELSSHLQHPQTLAPLLDLEAEEVKDEEIGGRGRETRLRSRSIHRRARSMSPMRSRFQWEDEVVIEEEKKCQADPDPDPKQEVPVAASDSASSSRSSSSGRNSKRWVFLKDLLYRSKSEGRGRDKESSKIWLSMKPSKSPPIPTKSKSSSGSNISAAKRRVPAPSAHERLYTANRAQAEEMRRRTFLPYRQGLLGCLGFSSRGYGAVNGFAKTLNPVSTR